MHTQKSYLFISLLSVLMFNSQSYAGPVVKLCTELDCKHPASIEITDSTWSAIKDLYKTPFQTDKDEQDNIASSIALIERDVFMTLAGHHSTDENTALQARQLFAQIESDNRYRNIKNYLGILLDNHLVTRHYLRNTITLKSWAGIEKEALLLQSLDDSKRYLLKIIDIDLGQAPAIFPYKENINRYDNKVIKKTSHNKSDTPLKKGTGN